MSYCWGEVVRKLHIEDGDVEDLYVFSDHPNVSVTTIDKDIVLVNYGSWVYWAFLEWIQSDTDGSNSQYRVVCCGEGTGGTTREARHTYFGENGDGYVPDLRVKNLVKAFEILGQYFDL